MFFFLPADFVSAKSANLGIHTSKYRSTMLTDFIMLYFLYCICFLLDQFRFLIYFFVLIFWSLVAARQFAGPAIVSFLSTTLPINHSTTLPLHPSTPPPIHPSIHPLAFQPQRLIHFAAAPGLPASHSAIVCILQKLRILPGFSRTKSLKETSKPVPSDPVISKSPNPKPKLKNLKPYSF
jgi:hypothetical protein